MKLWEGNVFTPVCLSVNGGGDPYVTITDDALDLTVQSPLANPSPAPGHQIWDPSRPRPWTSDMDPQPTLDIRHGTL